MSDNYMSTRKVALSSIASQLPGEIDLFICSASFEPRCRSVAEHMNVSCVRSAVLFHSSLSLDSVHQNTRVMCDKLASARPLVAKLDTDDPIGSEDTIASVLEKTQQGTRPRHVVVDISTFTREFLFFLLNHLRRLTRLADKVTLAYVGASKYSSSVSLEDIWLSQGVRTVRSVAGFPGESLPSRPLHLIILAGFESDRASHLIEYYEPAVLSIGYGPKESSITEGHHQVNLAFHNKIVALYQDVHRFEFPPNDPVGTWLAIKLQVTAFVKANVVLAAMNTKLSTVGAALAAFNDPSIQLCYAQADIYNYDCYSSPAEDAYLFELQPFLTGN